MRGKTPREHLQQLQRQIKDHTRGQAVKGINIGDVRKLQIPLPPLAEQFQIAEGFSTLDDVAARNSSELVALTRTKSALMSVLLTGEVRITPDDTEAAP